MERSRGMWWLVVVVGGVLATVGIGAVVPEDGGPTGFDQVVGDGIDRVLGGHRGVFEVLVIPSNGYILLPLLAVGAVWYARRRQWWSAGFLVVAPELVVAVNAVVLKPLWHRHLHDYLAYPSGHTVQFVAIATAFVLVAERARTRVVETVVAMVVLVVVAVGMIGLGYHYPTDVLGGTAAAVALVTAMYAAVAAIRARRSAVPTARTTAPTRRR
ncbi:phosphatase PAP2 family protein [Nocardia sp. NPDC051570]|uniref:phosphatase PAP2 family protein n=1 Tax=Nocardia sp. NPDC051570 TaxID=3364324 RepID=UPI0037972E0E